MTDQEQHPDPERLWRHRKRGYYIGIWMMWIQTVVWAALGLYSPQAIQALAVVIGSAYGCAITLVIQYSANTAVEEWAKRGAK